MLVKPIVTGSFLLAPGAAVRRIYPMLKKLRKRRKLTQEALALRAGVSTRTIGFWEDGNHLPSLRLAQRVARVLGVSLERFLAALEEEGRRKKA